MELVFERVRCSRCGGAGHMPYAVEGGRCFKCGRAGTVYTAAASKLAAELLAAQMVPVGELRPGDTIKAMGLTHGGQPFEYNARVLSVDPDTSTPGRWFSNGVERPTPTDRVVVTHTGYGKGAGTTGYHTTASATVRRMWTTGAIQAWLAAHRFVGKRERKGIVEVTSLETYKTQVRG